MSRHARIPKTLGADFRARRRQDPSPAPLFGKCTTRPMTPEERAWIESLPKPDRKRHMVGVNLWGSKDL
jgi:hypothetical protein